MHGPRSIGTIIFLAFLAPLAGCDRVETGTTMAASPFGIHEVRFTNPVVDEAAALQDIGAATARISPYGSLIWDLIEKEKDVYDWTDPDKVLGAGAGAGVALFVGVGAQNRLDGGGPGPGSLPKDIDWHLRFLKKAIERYDGDGVDDAAGSPKIDVVQIGNEVDGAAFWQDTPENYAFLLKRSYQTIRQAAPNMRVAIAGAATPAGYYSFYRPVLTELNRIKDAPGDRYFDIFDLHWSGQFTGDDDYDIISLPGGAYDLKTFVADIKSDLASIGYTGIPLYITEMSDYSDSPAGYANLSEARHAAAVVKRYVYALAAGIEKIFWAQMYEEHDAGGIVNGYFDNVGLINNALNPDGFSHKKLAYYSYKKMTEMLEGSDWKNIQVLQDADHVRVYGFRKNGKFIYAAWWDYLRDPGYASGQTKAITIAGVQGGNIRTTDGVPQFSTGANVIDYATAFATTSAVVENGRITITLTTTPVYIEVLP